MNYTVWSKLGFGAVVFVLIGFAVTSLMGKEEVSISEDYKELNKAYVSYDSASKIAEKSVYLMNLRTEEDFEKLRNDKEYIHQDLYNEFILAEEYAGVYKKDIVTIDSIKGQELGKGEYVFKLELTVNGFESRTYLTYIENSVITRIRSLGDV